MAGWYERQRADLLIAVRLTPRASRDGLEGMRVLADGTVVLAARVRAVAADNAANEALGALLAARLGIARTAVAVVAGHRQRLKKVKASGCGGMTADEIEARLTG